METPAPRPLSAEQVISLVMQLPAADRQKVLTALQPDRDAWWRATQRQSEAKLRALAEESGLDWTKMTEPEREAFVDQLLHER